MLLFTTSFQVHWLCCYESCRNEVVQNLGHMPQCIKGLDIVELLFQIAGNVWIDNRAETNIKFSIRIVWIENERIIQIVWMCYFVGICDLICNYLYWTVALQN